MIKPQLIRQGSPWPFVEVLSINRKMQLNNACFHDLARPRSRLDRCLSLRTTQRSRTGQFRLTASALVNIHQMLPSDPRWSNDLKWHLCNAVALKLIRQSTPISGSIPGTVFWYLCVISTEFDAFLLPKSSANSTKRISRINFTRITCDARDRREMMTMLSDNCTIRRLIRNVHP